MNIKEISISVEQEKSVSLEVSKSNEIGIGFEKREVLSEPRVERSFYDFDFTFNEEDGSLSLTLIQNNGVSKNLKIDLPTEELVKDVSYNNETKEINIEWENGQTTKIPLSGLVDTYKADELTLTLDNETKTFKIKEEYLQNKYVPQELDIFSNIDTNKDRSKLSIFVDEEGTPKKVSMRAMLDTKIRTVNEVPNDLQENEYIYLEIK